MRFRFRAAIVIAVLFISLTIYWFYFKKEDVKATPSVSQFDWPIECKASYSFNVTTSSVYGDDGTEEYDLSVTGILNTKFIDKTEIVSGIWQLSDVIVHGNGDRDLILEKLYATPFKIELSKSGAFKSFIFPNSIPDDDKEMLRQLFYQFEVILPEHKQTKYVAKQTDEMGLYIASYSRSINKGNRTKLKYVQSEVPLAFQPMIEIPESKIHFRMASSGCWISQMNGRERIYVEMGLDENRFTTKGITTLSLEKRDHLAISDIWNRTDILNLPSIENETRSVREIKKQSVLDDVLMKSNVTFKDLVVALVDDDTQSFDLLKRYLETHPADIRRVPQLIRSGELSDGVIAKLLMVLGEVGTATAQETLLSIWEDHSFKNNDRLRAVIALSSLEKIPTSDMFERLTAGFMSVKSGGSNSELLTTPVMIAGIVIQNLKVNYIEQAIMLNRELIDLLNLATNPVQINTVLHSIGNSQINENAAIVEGYIGHPDASVRETAAHVAGRYQDEMLTESLVVQLQKEQNTAVEEAILKGLESHNLKNEHLPVVEEEVLGAKDAGIRAAAIELLATHKHLDPEGINNILKEAYRSETSRENIKKIINAFAQ